MQKVLEMRIAGEFFEGPPILLAALLAQFRAHGREVQSVLVHRRIFDVRLRMIFCVHGSLVCVVIVLVAVDRVVFAHTVH